MFHYKLNASCITESGIFIIMSVADGVILADLILLLLLLLSIFCMISFLPKNFVFRTISYVPRLLCLNMQVNDYFPMLVTEDAVEVPHLYNNLFIKSR